MPSSCVAMRPSVDSLNEISLRSALHSLALSRRPAEYLEMVLVHVMQRKRTREDFGRTCCCILLYSMLALEPTHVHVPF